METLELGMIKPFDIMLGGRPTWLSKQIKKIIKADISHSAVFFTVDKNIYVHESDRYGLRNADFVEYYFNRPDYKIYIARPKIKATLKQEREFKHLAIKTAGHKPYDFMNLIFHQPVKWFMKRVFNKDVWWGKRKTDSNNRFICSERTAYIMDNFFSIEPNYHKISTEHFLHSDNYEVYELKR